MERVRAAILAVVIVVSGAAETQAQKLKRNVSTATAELCELLVPCLPPPPFAAGPFLGKPSIRHVGMTQLSAICNGVYAQDGRRREVHAFAAGDETLGCAELAGDTCVIHLPIGLQAKLPALYRLVLAHELGHCRGWRH